MRITIVSDIHSNLAALEAVLRHAEQRQALDALWSLGDIVGYGPQPNEVIALLQRYAIQSVMGNHDLAATGGMDTRDFNDDAATANAWNARRLSAESGEFLRSLPNVICQPAEQATFCHGSLRWPTWEYLFSEEAAEAQFRRMTTRYSFVGHTHVPLIFACAGDESPVIAYEPADRWVQELGEPLLTLNPGSVGQPRDGDPRAAYAVLDTGRWAVEFYRVPYQIEQTQALMLEAGLPRRLITRLSVGR